MQKISSILLLFLISFMGIYYWYSHKNHVSTNNAYVNANISHIAPRLTGRVDRIFIHNNQWVIQGQPLFHLDPEPFNIALDQAKAALLKAEAEYHIAEMTSQRTLTLVKRNAASAQEGDSKVADLQSANASVQLAIANLHEATLHLNYTTITAPANGWVTNVNLQVGDLVSENAPLFALIGTDQFWVDANFKETELARIHAGQKATIDIDMYTTHHFHGVVESISNGTGPVFSLLPPENATGNWVKVTQRIPVRIRILDPHSQYPLRIGSSAKVVISYDHT